MMILIYPISLMTHYQLSKQQERGLSLGDDGAEYKIASTTAIGSSEPKDKQAVLLSEIIARMNVLLAGEGLTDKDIINYVNTMTDKVR